MDFEDEEAELRFLESSLLDAKLPVFIQPALAHVGKGATIAALPAEKPMLNGRSQAMDFEDEEAELRFLESSLLDAKLPVFIQPVLAHVGKGATIAALPAEKPMLLQEDLSNPLNGKSQAMDFEDEEAELR